ncbi:MAG: hypothetical protein JSW41_02615 [Candidatus Aenigmatarchaeota archaeon]|nr:MAG: hypothetical protein JSW41_02615 [Candidatus Aenigmarchaeota archaeon]
MKGPAMRAGVTAAAGSLLSPEPPEFPTPQEWYGGAYGQVPGLKFDAQGNVIGVDPNSLPSHVTQAIAEVDQILEQRVEALRNEAARAGMLNSSAFLREVQLLEAEGVEAKQEIMSRYVYDATNMAHQRAMAGGGYAAARYGQEYGQYQQQAQMIQDAIAAMFEQMESEKQRKAAAEEAERERQAQMQQLVQMAQMLRG